MKGKMQGLPAAGPEEATQDEEDAPDEAPGWSWAWAAQLAQFLAQPRDVRQLQELQKESAEHFGQLNAQKKSSSQLQEEQITRAFAGAA